MPTYTNNEITWNFTTYVDDGTTYASIGDGTNSSGNATTLGISLNGPLTIPSTVTSSGTTYTVKKIGRKAFRETNITSVAFPDSVEIIDTAAFSACQGIISVTIPDSGIVTGHSLTSVQAIIYYN